MRFRTYEYRNGEVILNANHRLKKEIETVLSQLELGHRNGNGRRGEGYPHQQIQRAFERQDWKSEVLVSPRTARRHYFDLYKDRVAIEIELSNRELLYRDYLRFELAEADGRLDVGVLLLLDEEARYTQPAAARNGFPRLEDVVDDLSSLRGAVSTPIWVVSLY